jgi:hypothetical protein
VADDKHSVEVGLGDNPETRINVSLSARELDQLIIELARTRAELADQVPLELHPGTKVIAQLDPCWRTYHSPHPALNCLLLNLRHSGLGWLAFLLPRNEAQVANGCATTRDLRSRERVGISVSTSSRLVAVKRSLRKEKS